MSISNNSSLFSEALVLLDDGDFVQGQVKLEEVIESSRRQEDFNTLIPALVCMADLQVQLDEFERADALLGEVFSCEKKIEVRNKKEEQQDDETLVQDIQNAHFVHDMLMCRRVFNKALDLLETDLLEDGEFAMLQAITLSEQKKCYDTLLASLICMADMLIQLKRPEEAKVFLDKALTYESSGEAVANLPTYKEVFADNFERARELLTQI